MTKSAFLFLSLSIAGGLGSPGRAAADDSDPQKPVAQKYVLVLGSFTSFHEARKRALAISHASKMTFSTRGMVYDQKRGLIVPDNDADGVYAGLYASRRYNTERQEKDGEEAEYVSLERSEAYEGFRRGYYMIVGGIYDDADGAAKALARFKPIVADAYAKKTKIYMGCVH